jgi:hypothetical protein
MTPTTPSACCGANGVISIIAHPVKPDVCDLRPRNNAQALGGKDELCLGDHAT